MSDFLPGHSYDKTGLEALNPPGSSSSVLLSERTHCWHISLVAQSIWKESQKSISDTTQTSISLREDVKGEVGLSFREMVESLLNSGGHFCLSDVFHWARVAFLSQVGGGE